MTMLTNSGNNRLSDQRVRIRVLPGVLLDETSWTRSRFSLGWPPRRLQRLDLIERGAPGGAAERMDA